ncbi:Uncharacterized conserved protein, NAD-dependent epimerase/dehydratase family [Halorientalis persicus]|uniref:Uncharacterized conserved protein, NAD-dependent epimerase/dehydratase family n=1 Tax=Halorientalis persicus TaxID=1367881 RepID=A0A1H8DNC9_9EURY|nr:DUF1611 domain-containing protein [Halorientalis persicus]SEN08851.1 Uncharacterized conserved protein, NAD-dependent epimerase/dehydratase family [Halorientalis persicus]
MNVAVLAHERFPDRAKTAVGVLRYADYDVTAVLDRDRAGDRVADHLPDVQDAPIVAGIEDVPDPIDALVIGIAPIGGDFDESWRPDVRGAIERGCDVLSGLHYFLTEDDEFAALADDHGVELRDLRRPPADLTVAEGHSREVDADVVLTVGTDCSTGKMTTSAELVAAARERGIDAALIPTGQTGVLIEDWGIVVDRVPSDFVAGAVERMVRERGDDHDLLVVEGQGSITHPAYSAVTCGILHGAMPDQLVLCHEAGREAIHGYESFAIPPIPEVGSLYEDLAAPVADTTVAAGALNTSGLDDADANQAVIEYATAIDAPATDPVRFGADELLDALV